MKEETEMEFAEVKQQAQMLRYVLMEFRSLREIFEDDTAWFDNNGNLWVHELSGQTMLEARNLCLLGKVRRVRSDEKIPDWALKNQWEDAVSANRVLKLIAQGKMSREQMMELAAVSFVGIPLP